MLAAARTAAAIASGSRAVAPQAFNPRKTGDLYRTEVAWADVGVDQKMNGLTRWSPRQSIAP
jgi:hypothetical protein